LTKRLAAAASAVREGSRVADVGCDHGKLAAWLVFSGKCAHAYAIDISEPSLQKAADLFSSLGVAEKTTALLADGLETVEPDLVDDVIIGGLGYDTIKKIIADAEWLKDESKRLVLVPSSKHDRLRRFLYMNGFAIDKELAVSEYGHVYAVMTVRYHGIKRILSAPETAFGGILNSDGDNLAYVQAVRRRCERLMRQAKEAKSSRPSDALKEAIEIIGFLEAGGRKEGLW